MEAELERVVTTSRDSSDGEIWGIQGRLLWVTVGGVVLSILAVTVCMVSFRMASLGAVAVGSLPAAVTIAFVTFRQTAPDGFGSDLVDSWIHGRGFGPPTVKP